MVKRVFFVNPWVLYLILANNFIPSLKLVPIVNKYFQGVVNTEGLYFKTKDNREAYLPFSNNEEVEAKQVFKTIGN